MDFNLNEITQDDGYIHVYGDASFTDKLGIAWVIATHDIENPIKKNKTNTNRNMVTSRHATLAGEFSAVLLALRQLPEGQKVRIHTDNKIVLSTLNQLLDTGSKAHNGDLVTRSIVSAISKIMTFHEQVDIQYSHDGRKEPSSLKRYYMAIAHNLAADASGAVSHKDIPDPHAPDGVYLVEKPHDSSSTMDIIDLEKATQDPDIQSGPLPFYN